MKKIIKNYLPARSALQIHAILFVVIAFYIKNIENKIYADYKLFY